MLREIIAEVKMPRVVIANRLSSSVTQLYWDIGKRLATEKLKKRIWWKSCRTIVCSFEREIS